VKRTLLALVALVLAAVLLSACGGSAEPNAATVDSTGVNRASFEDELQAIADNKPFAANLKKNQIDIAPTKGSINSQLSSEWLNLLVSQVFVDKEFAQKKLKVSAKNRSDAKAAAAAIFGGAAVFDKFPKWFQDRVTQRQERVEALSATIPAAAAPDDATLEQYFNDSMKGSCITNQLVEHILVPTQAQADAIEAQLAQGADFATLAQQQSTDTGSAQRGGELWCTASQDFVNSDPDFRTAAVALKTGETSAPVKSQFGYHVIRLVPWNFENAKGIVAADYAQRRDTPLATRLNRQLLRAKLWVDPRYGTLNRSGGTIRVQPPKAPNPKSRPPDTTPTTPLGTPSP
jgi:PPIC-type PPIASE domain